MAPARLRIPTEFSKPYSAAGTAYAGRKFQLIDSPHLYLFGMATPEQLRRALGSSSVGDGALEGCRAVQVGDHAAMPRFRRTGWKPSRSPTPA
jgi:hypothetical protein